MANHQWKNINIIAMVYGVLMFINGLANGYFDNDRMQKIDLAFRYHLLTFIIVNGIHCIYSIIPDSHFNSCFKLFKHHLALINCVYLT
jgi:site-specific recombinase